MRIKTWPTTREGWATYYARIYVKTKSPGAEKMMWVYMVLAEAERQGDL